MLMTQRRSCASQHLRQRNSEKIEQVWLFQRGHVTRETTDETQK